MSAGADLVSTEDLGRLTKADKAAFVLFELLQVQPRENAPQECELARTTFPTSDWWIETFSDGSLEVGRVIEFGFFDVGANKVGVLETGPLKTCATQVSRLEVRSLKVGAPEVCKAEVSLREIYHTEVSIMEAHAAQMGRPKVPTCQDEWHT